MRDGTRRAIALFNVSGPGRSEDDIVRALATEPQDARLHVLLSYCKLARGEFETARQSAERAIVCDPECDRAFRALAVIEATCRRFPNALRSIDEALRIDPKNADYYFVKATVQFYRGRCEAAIEAADEGLRCDAKNTSCGNVKAAALLHMGRLTAADALLRELLKVDPECARTYENLGNLELRRDNPADARRFFREALRLKPTCLTARLGVMEASFAQWRSFRLLRGVFAMRDEDDPIDLMMRLAAVWPVSAVAAGISTLVLPPYEQPWDDVIRTMLLGAAGCIAVFYVSALMFRLATNPATFVVLGVRRDDRKYLAPGQAIRNGLQLAGMVSAVVAPTVAFALRSYAPIWIGGACVTGSIIGAYVFRSQEGRAKRLARAAVRVAILAGCASLAVVGLSWTVLEFDARTWSIVLELGMVLVLVAGVYVMIVQRY
jgi:tetratricopeptide (TPR) repeat protein